MWGFARSRSRLLAESPSGERAGGYPLNVGRAIPGQMGCKGLAFVGGPVCDIIWPYLTKSRRIWLGGPPPLCTASEEQY